METKKEHCYVFRSKVYLNMKEACEDLGINSRTFKTLVRNNKIKKV